MRFVPITPPTDFHYRTIWKFPMHFALAHALLKHHYYACFFQLVRKNPNNYIILDNGALEGELITDYDKLDGLIESLEVNEFILPDRLFLVEDTKKLTYDAYHRMRTKWPNLKLQGVPQGSTIDEWWRCALWMIEVLGVDVVGVPLRYNKWHGGRELMFNLIAASEVVRTGKVEVHFLGWNRNEIPKDFKNAHLIRSIDSAKPFTDALVGKSTKLISQGKQYPSPRPDNFFSFDNWGRDDETPDWARLTSDNLGYMYDITKL